MENRDMVKKVAIVGIGIQGSMIAFRNALHGKQVRGYSRTEKSAAVCRDKIERWAAYYVKIGKITEEEAQALIGRMFSSSGKTGTCTWKCRRPITLSHPEN
jgi:3-hydroxybutyryl-CoA dehydrogenase